jgi:predicted amidophosphoribosyltransferase
MMERSGLPLARVLERGSSAQQKKLGRAERLDNAGSAFRMRPRARAPREALLIDDVFTTGATAEACAHALKNAGADSVSVLVLAVD